MNEFVVGRVIVGVDDTDAGIAALREAIAMACAHHAPLVAVRAWQLGLPRHGGRRFRYATHPHIVIYFSGAEQHVAASVLIRKALARATAQVPVGLELQMETPQADPAVALTSIAQQPGDVLVLGGRRFVSPRVIAHGSVTNYCLRHAHCPIVVVPPGRAPRRHDRPAMSARTPSSRSMPSVSFPRSGTAS
jgi:nucleotide-binding universal stress UspA family protein